MRPYSRAPVLVTDGDERSSLAVVRSLGAAGHPVYVTSHDRRSLAGVSAFTRENVAVPDALKEPEAYAAELAKLSRNWAVDAIVPMTEPSLNATLSRPELFSHTVLASPPWAQFRAISDKELVLGRAKELGIQTPVQVRVKSRAEALLIDPSQFTYPVVLKPARSVGKDAEGLKRLGVRHADSAHVMREVIQQLPDAAYPLLIQQRIFGPGVGVFLLRWNGELIAACAHRRLREKPPAGGVSTYRESVPLDPKLLAQSLALIASFDWNGVAMVEYKMDARTNTPNLMEINGRFWGSLQLAVDAGVDFPRLLLECVLGPAPAPLSAPYQTGIRSRWWWGDMDHLLARLRYSDAHLSLPPNAPSRLQTAVATLIPWRPGDRWEILHRNDPRPFVHESINWPRGK